MIYYIIDNGMSYDDHGLHFIPVPEEYAHLDADLRLVLPHLVSGEAEHPHDPQQGKYLVMVARDAEVVREGHGYYWQTLEYVVGNLWPPDGNLTKRVANLVEDGYKRVSVGGRFVVKKRYRYEDPMELTVPVDEETQEAADRLFEALPTEWFPGECSRCGRTTRGAHTCRPRS